MEKKHLEFSVEMVTENLERYCKSNSVTKAAQIEAAELLEWFHPLFLHVNPFFEVLPDGGISVVYVDGEKTIQFQFDKKGSLEVVRK